jgi:hypothetical protein
MNEHIRTDLIHSQTQVTDVLLIDAQVTAGLSHEGTDSGQVIKTTE